jgi:hypothetical protein
MARRPLVGSSLRFAAAGLAFGLPAGGCSDSVESARVELPVVLDASAMIAVTNDLGWTFTVRRARGVVTDLEFTTAGELHDASARVLRPSATRWALAPAVPRAGLVSGLWDVLVPDVVAHPGHYAGGEVIGELPGRWVVDFVGDDGRWLGDAALILGDYNGANFTYGVADAADVEASDPLLGHSLQLEGTATRGGVTIAFTVLIDQDEDRQVVGLPLDVVVDRDAPAAIELGLRLVPGGDPSLGRSLFDGIDPEALDADGDGQVEIAADDEPALRLRRTTQTHDFFDVAVHDLRAATAPR